MSTTSTKKQSPSSPVPWMSTAIFAVVAVLVYHGVGDFYYFGFHQKTPSQRLSLKASSPPAPANLSPQEVADFRRDGFLLKKKVVTGKALEDLVRCGEEIHKAPSNALDHLFKNSFVKLAMQIWRQHEPFAEVAFQSSFPSISAELLGKPNSIRILKDGFFAFQSTNNTGCGFHVDDKAFWPVHDDTTGVNFWLALSHYDASKGGGIRVVNQSLLDKETFEKCRDSIRGGPDETNYTATCDMQQRSPWCHDKLLAASVVHDMEPGDVLLWDRWTFHRSEPYVSDVPDVKYRYTIRYVPDSATAFRTAHESVKPGERFHGPYYPQVWPAPIQEELDLINAGIGADFELTFTSVIKMIWRKLRT